MNPTLLFSRRSTVSRLAIGLIVGVCLLAGIGSGEAKPKKKNSEYLSKFGVMAPGADGNYRVYAETTYIHRNTDQGYVHGFEVVRKDQQRFLGYFEIRFPSPIELSPELEKAYTVMEGGKFIRSESQIYWGIYTSPFWFSKGDPLGDYEMTIYLDGDVYRTIKYQVVPFESGLAF